MTSGSKPDPQVLDASVVRATSSPTMSMFLEFLEVPGNVLLIQGPPGTGKTTLAFEILNAVQDSRKVYASSGVSPVKLRIQFPWIDEVIDSMSGRSCFSVSTGTFSSESAAEALKAYIGDKALAERVRIVEFNSQLPSKPWRLKVRGQMMSDLAEFYRSWNALKATSRGMMLTMNFDKLVQVYGEELTLPGFTEIGEGLRDEGAFGIGISSRPTKVRDEFLRQADYHIKLQNWNGYLLIYGVKPFTHIHGASFDLDKGYPTLDLVEIV